MRTYIEFEGRSYVAGREDCYGLLRPYYWKNYKLRLKNYARPHGFSFQGLDLINKNLVYEGFEYVDAPLNRLEVGDGIIMSLTRSPLANHVAVYVGNQMMLHHLQGQKSIAENFGDKWKARVLNIVRHPLVTEQNLMTPDSVMKIYPPHAQT